MAKAVIFQLDVMTGVLHSKRVPSFKTKTCENLSETPLLSLVRLYTELLNGSAT